MIVWALDLRLIIYGLKAGDAFYWTKHMPNDKLSAWLCLLMQMIML